MSDDNLGENPTCDGNNTKMSRSAFHRAADSIAHACLWERFHQIGYTFQ